MFGLVTCLILASVFYQSFQQGKSLGELLQGALSTAPTSKIPDPPKEISPIPIIDNCQCVPYYLCNNDSKINTDGVGLIDIRADDGICSSYIELCCMQPEILKNPVTPTVVEKPKVCGRKNSDGVGFRIIGDTSNEAQFGEFPWMVAILHVESIPGAINPLATYQCGGALIHPQVVITAAHCVTSKEKRFKVRAGEWDTQTELEIFPHQDRNVKSVILHPEYYAGAFFNDIALLILDSPLEMSEHIDVVCLPPQGIVIPPGTRCFATGWGKDHYGKDGKYQVILKKIDLPIVDSQTCQHNLRQTRLGARFDLHESFVCAGGEPGKDTCDGDGGSPLVCPVPGEKNRYQHVGIVSWGIGCGETHIPGVYGNVGLFTDWINEEITKSLGTAVYEY